MSDNVRRYDYIKGSLKRSDLDSDPIVVLKEWLEQAAYFNVTEPSAMVLSTSSLTGVPSSRVVLLRDITDEGLVFFTNYQSRKGHELSENPHACVNFWWGDLERQVRVEGTVAKASSEVSDEYFASRPKASQAASVASPQSRAVESMELIEAEMSRLFRQESIARPGHWGGYVLRPTYFEFWQGGVARLHYRFAYELDGQTWTIQQLAP